MGYASQFLFAKLCRQPTKRRQTGLPTDHETKTFPIQPRPNKSRPFPPGRRGHLAGGFPFSLQFPHTASGANGTGREGNLLFKPCDTEKEKQGTDKDDRVRQVKKGEIVQRPKIKVNKVNDLPPIP